MDWTKFLKNEVLEDYVDKPIVIKGLSKKYTIEIHVIENEKDT